MLRTLRETFWILALAVVVLFGFFVALGAFDPGQLKGLTAAAVVLVGAWIVHAVLSRRGGEGGLDPAAARDRERRGF